MDYIERVILESRMRDANRPVATPGNVDDSGAGSLGVVAPAETGNDLPGMALNGPSSGGQRGQIPTSLFHRLLQDSRPPVCNASSRNGEAVKDMADKLSGCVALSCVPASFDPDVAYAGLDAEFPWFSEASGIVVSWMVASARAGKAFRLPPMLMDGPPGIGKTRWAKRVAGLCPGSSSMVVPFAGLDTTLNIIGCAQSYESAIPGFWFEAITRDQVANPVVVLDEIDKTGDRRPELALLSFLEPENARRFECPFFRTEIDLSPINYVATSNSVVGLAEPLLSRMTILSCRLPTEDEIERIVPDLAREVIADIATPDTVFVPDMGPLIAAYRNESSIRAIRRELERQARMSIWTSADAGRSVEAPYSRRIGFCR